MDEQKVNKLIQQGIENYMRNKQFNYSKIPAHEHNGVDTVKINRVNIINAQKKTSFIIADTTGSVTIANLPNVNTITFYGFVANNATTLYILTGSLLVGATSATLSSNWTLATEIRPVTFSNGDVRNVNFTNASSSITWTGGLSSSATSTITVGATKRATINGQAEFGQCYFTDSVVVTPAPGNVIQACNSMYIDQSDLTKNRVTTTNKYLCYAQDDTGTVLVQATVSYTSQIITIAVTTLASGWKLQGALIIT